MEQVREDNVIFMSREEWREWMPLIRKLRRIGLHEQARRHAPSIRPGDGMVMTSSLRP